MKTNYKVAIALIAGAAIGGAAIQGLHAQAKPKAYLVGGETKCWMRRALLHTQQLSGPCKRRPAVGVSSTRGKVVASVGDAPKRVGISEWDSLEQAQAYLNSEARKKLVQDGKVVKITRQYIVEAGN